MNNWPIPWLCTCVSKRVLAYNTIEYHMPTWASASKERSYSPTMPTDVTCWLADLTNVRWRIGQFLGCVCQKECWHTIPIPLSIRYWKDQLVQQCLPMLPDGELVWPMLDEKLANSLAVYLCMLKRVLAYNTNTLKYPMPTWPLLTKKRIVSPTMPADVTWWWADVTNVRWRIGRFLGFVC